MPLGVKQKKRIPCLKPTNSGVGHSQFSILNSYDRCYT